MALLNYTTQVQAAKTVGQIQDVLAKHGARSILLEYDDQGGISALSFQVPNPHGNLAFRLPVDPEAVLVVLQRQWRNRQIPYRYGNRTQAVKVAWRIVKDWVEAQMAILETEMVRMEQIFLPYLVVDGSRTLYQAMLEKRFLLGPGEGESPGVD